MRYQPTEKQIRDAYDLARERYALLGVDTDAALARLAQIPISLHCWQGDDVAGFENPDGELGAALQPRATIPARPEPPPSCAATWTWPTGSSLVPTG